MANPSIGQYLTDNDFFSGLASDYAEFLAAHARTRRLRKDEVLFHHGTPANRFYLIAAGSISIEVAAIEGPSLQLQLLGPGAVIGWSWLIAPYRWAFQARAEEPTEIVEFDGEAVLARCEEDPRFGYELLKRFSALMSERLQFARQKMMEEWNPPGFA
jgi:CRP/FNR family cyclic AMP-dependent transcriptional regulator